MNFSLIDETGGAIPIAALTKDRLTPWLEAAPERERNWLRAIGFSADAGKLALVPGERGGLARVLVGLGEARRRRPGDLGARRDCPRRCRREAIGSKPFRTAPIRRSSRSAGRFGTYAFTRYHAKSRTAAALVWPEARRSRPGRAARRRRVPRP